MDRKGVRKEIANSDKHSMACGSFVAVAGVVAGVGAKALYEVTLMALRNRKDKSE